MTTDYKQQFKSALDYGVNPAGWTGTWSTSTDMTAAIQLALNDEIGCPNGATLYIPPGTYRCSGGLNCWRPISIWAFGVTLDFGPTEFILPESVITAFTYGTETANRVTRTFVGGLALKRTRVGASSSYCNGHGFRWYALIEVTVESCSAQGFEKGHWITGSYDSLGSSGTERGNAYNNYRNLKALLCKYGLYLEPGDFVQPGGGVGKSGWCNENNFWGGRVLLSSDITDPQNCEAIHVRWTTENNAKEPHGPNNNRFYGLSLEGIFGYKIFCEGFSNYWSQCRYENPNGGIDVQFKDSVGGDGGGDNALLYGNALDATAVDMSLSKEAEALAAIPSTSKMMESRKPPHGA